MHSQRSLINFAWLLNLRWAAVLGQLGTVLSVEFGLGVELPLTLLLSLIAFAALSNLLLSCYLWALRRGEAVAAGGVLPVLLGSVMILDLLLLTALLYVSGGPSNPFSIFYLVNVLLASLLLPQLWGWALAGFGGLCFAFLFYAHEPLPGLPAISGEPSVEEMNEAWKLYLLGLGVAFGALSLTLFYFFSRLRTALAKLGEELELATEQRERSRRLEGMATLAAGAAHELATPLSTIAVVAKELERALQKGGSPERISEDARLIRQEVQRCREILDQMSSDAGESTGEGPQVFAVQQLCDEVIMGCKAPGRVMLRACAGAAELRLDLPRTTVVRALRNLVNNAIDGSATGQEVEFLAEKVADGLLLTVRDEGQGMDAETLERAGSPFFTTKEVGEGMGLGLFLTRTVLDRLGARFELESQPGIGTLARVWFSEERILQEEPGR